VNTKALLWAQLARDDLEVAELIFASGRYAHTLLMCQQAIEKAIKAVYVNKRSRFPPRRHDLLALCRDAAVYDQLPDEWKVELAHLSALYVVTRYPDENAEQLREWDHAQAKRMLSLTEEVLVWLEDKMR
jgi:HEPN domain-containing protein